MPKEIMPVRIFSDLETQDPSQVIIDIDKDL